MENSKPNKPLAVLNIMAFLGTVTVNTLANSVKIGGRMTGEISDSIPNLFVPAGITFAVWGVIYLLLLAFTVWQARLLFRADESLARRVNAVGPWFIITSVFNMAWIFTWHFLLIGLSLVVMLALFTSLIVLYLRLNAVGGRPSFVEGLCLRAPFSVYLGWISVATIANVTAVLVTAGWDGFGLPQAFWTVTVIVAAAAVALAGMIIRKDFMFGLVFVWAFLGIWLKRSAPDVVFVPEVAYAALIALILAAAGAAVAIVRTVVRSRA
jgi:hypothetical protein